MGINFVITNGVNLDTYRVRSRSNNLIETYNLKDRFVVGYIGTIGLAHSLDIILNLPKKIGTKRNIFLLLVKAPIRKDY